MQPADFNRLGWARFPFDPALKDWVDHVRPIAGELASDGDLRDAWLRCGGTWFAGVNVLPNTTRGELGKSGELTGVAVSFLETLYPDHALVWDQAQISVCYPGYPMPTEGESETNFAFRLNRDAAHMDGLHAVGAQRRRHWRELHGFVLGIPLSEADPKAAPLVVWEGSHEILRAVLREELDGVPREAWSSVDLTDAYSAARREIFDSCRRVELAARPGEATLLHRFALHGVAPWEEGTGAAPDGRMIAYFRPSFGWTAHSSLTEP